MSTDAFFIDHLSKKTFLTTHFWQIFKSQLQQNSKNAIEKLAFIMYSWIGSFNSKIADPIRSDQGVSDLDLDPIQIHKNRIFDPDRGSFRSDHYTTAVT